MKTGLDYTASGEKRGFDIAVASLLLPGKRIGELIVKRLAAQSSGLELPAIVVQERMGQYHQTFAIQKFTTLHPTTELPLGGWAAKLRRSGLDELAQLANIRAGDMSFTGPRPLLVPEYEETRDALSPKLGRQWDNVVRAAKPGLYSSYAIYSHTRSAGDPNGPEVRAEMDIRDFQDASMRYDIALTAQFIGIALARRLK